MKNIRTFAVRLGPDIADPAYIIPLTEYDPSKKTPEGAVLQTVQHTGWRANLVARLIKRLLPYPKELYE